MVIARYTPELRIRAFTMLDLDAFDRICRFKDAEKPAPMQEPPAGELEQSTKIENYEIFELVQNALKHELKREVAEEPELVWHGDGMDKERMQEELRRAIHLDRVEDFSPEREDIPDCDLLMDELDQQMEEIALRRFRPEKEPAWDRVAMTAAALIVCISISRELSYWW
ncbi:unnamed protein product [Clonostachys solani]|uniref:Uncharacterized protein n=1 Tax=Clonostachys solani TaxID=160281 RepID=A0A9N9YZG8_9HYPO|nr:unnamed protein product [Clonostachys solani]